MFIVLWHSTERTHLFFNTGSNATNNPFTGSRVSGFLCLWAIYVGERIRYNDEHEQKLVS